MMAWTAFTQISSDSSGWYHAYAPVSADSKEEAIAGAEYVLNTLAKGKLTIIRCKPDATSEMDFETQEIKYKGFVRFSYRDELGEWEHAVPDHEIPAYIRIGSGDN